MVVSAVAAAAAVVVFIINLMKIESIYIVLLNYLHLS